MVYIVRNGKDVRMVVYICASLLHLAVESRNLSQAEKKVTVVKPEQIHKIVLGYRFKRK